jgi:hypothetical protein
LAETQAGQGVQEMNILPAIEFGFNFKHKKGGRDGHENQRSVLQQNIEENYRQPGADLYEGNHKRGAF